MQTAAGGATAIGLAKVAQSSSAKDRTKRKKRTIYYNDARHYYLYVFEPPMKLYEARWPVDEVAGTTVDTFIYGVERGDGLFYPSKIGMLFGADKKPFTLAAYWRAWENMQSLIARGFDPLQILIDRAHDKGMDFFASLRMASYGGMKPAFKTDEGGQGLAHKEVRDHQFAVLQELAHRYNVEGIELDFAAAPGGSSHFLRPEDAQEHTPMRTPRLPTANAAPYRRAGPVCRIT